MDLFELFNQPYTYHWTHSNVRQGYLQAEFTTDDNSKVDVIFGTDDIHFEDPSDDDAEGELNPNALWDITFERGETMNVSGQGDAYRIFATVLQIITEFIHRANPKRITFLGSGQSRVRLYERMIKQLSSKFGFKPTKETFGKTARWVLER